MKIKTFIIEEHNEAYFIWNYAIRNSVIPGKNNLLLHVDEHSDMVAPRFNVSIDTLPDNLDEIRKFTYTELGIASFIVPAFYKNIFSDIFWVKQNHAKNRVTPLRMYVRSYNDDGKMLIMGKLADLDNYDTIKHKDIQQSHVEFNYHFNNESEIPQDQNFVLDIDLDYFSCAGNPNENKEIYIEITRDEFEEFNENPYHRLKFLIPRVSTLFNDGQYYYVFNQYDELYPSQLLKDEDVIRDRINSFCESLKVKNVRPLMIDICRSKHSGYTHADQCQLIEDLLLEGLHKLFEMEIIHINELELTKVDYI
ncbi:hypothetical protein TH53_23700 [Pedobacter lusitanus]|uniref:Uncharacterized protein n=1 Tax=Pedobacter lusitanus TaxID=1503925 RepID=A0A0D0GC75_9SPHI|nr:UPF0489 family protein [Pedobacter lusitanus]KIO74892.1 hypothetical protein TH53_23700 [Pedobacter lusitanus]